MKKNSRFLLVMIASLYAISGTVSLQAAEMPMQEIEADYAPPVFSLGQAKELRDRFVSWLGTHYRCLYAGKCTRTERSQVLAEWKTWTKRLGLAVVVGLAYYFGKLKVAQARERVRALKQDVKSEAYQIGQAATRGALGLSQDDEIDLKRVVSDLVSEAALALLKPQPGIGAPAITRMSPQDIKARIEEIARDTATAAVKRAIGMPEDEMLTTPALLGLVKKLAGDATEAALSRATVRMKVLGREFEVFPRATTPQATRSTPEEAAFAAVPERPLAVEERLRVAEESPIRAVGRQSDTGLEGIVGGDDEPDLSGFSLEP